MYLKELNIINFKSIQSEEVTFNERINCFVGDNGAGKTNILEAIYYLSLCKSLTGTTDRQNVTHNKDFMMLDGRYCDSYGATDNYTCAFSKGGGKSVKKNGKLYSKISSHIGSVPIVVITPRDNNLIDEAGDTRRRFLDTFISQFNPEYLSSLIKYNSIISQRNQLLRACEGAELSDMIEIYNMQLDPLAEAIYEVRDDVIKELSVVVQEYYTLISGGSEEVSVTYSSQLNKGSMLSLLVENMERDINMGYTTVGIGRDDIKLNIEEYPVKRFGSQGQQKSFIIALKLAQYDILTRRRGFKPILLLDDLFDRLDSKRVDRLMGIIQRSSFGQVFITDCDRARIEEVLRNKGEEYKLFDIKQGEINE